MRPAGLKKIGLKNAGSGLKIRKLRAEDIGQRSEIIGKYVFPSALSPKWQYPFLPPTMSQGKLNQEPVGPGGRMIDSEDRTAQPQRRRFHSD